MTLEETKEKVKEKKPWMKVWSQMCSHCSQSHDVLGIAGIVTVKSGIGKPKELSRRKWQMDNGASMEICTGPQ